MKRRKPQAIDPHAIEVRDRWQSWRVVRAVGKSLMLWIFPDREAAESYLKNLLDNREQITIDGAETFGIEYRIRRFHG